MEGHQKVQRASQPHASRHFMTVFLCKYVKHETVYQSDIVFYLDKVSISDVATVTRPKQLNIVLFLLWHLFCILLSVLFKKSSSVFVKIIKYVTVYFICLRVYFLYKCGFLIKNKLPHQRLGYAV